jgi:non-canonical poly(A) RNA polymerase PAPD5/7
MSRISDAISDHPMFRRTKVRSFGSFASGLYLPTADMDLVIISSHYERTGDRALGQTKVLWTAANLIERAGISAAKVQVISRARVPIIKFVDSVTKVKVDISFDNLTGITANRTFQEWKAEFPALLPLVAIIKQFLLMRELNEVQFGGLGGFSITCLVASLLQQHPAIQSGKMIPQHHLGQLLIEFFDLYGNKFNMSTTGIMMRPPGYFPKV